MTTPIVPGETYEDARFEGVIALEADLRGCSFVDCVFEGCDLTMARMDGVTVRGTAFVACRLLGVDVGSWRSDGLGIEATFRECDLDKVRLRDVDVRTCVFEGGHARGSEWTRVDARGVSFDGVDLSQARFVRCDLRGADLRRAVGLRLDVTANRIEGMRVSMVDALRIASDLGLDVDL